MSKKNKQPIVIQFDYINQFPAKEGNFELKWSCDKMKGSLTSLNLQKNKTILFKTTDIIEIQLDEQIKKQHLHVLINEVSGEGKNKTEHSFGKGKVDLVPYINADEKQKVCIKMEDGKKSYDMYVNIFNKNLTTFEDVKGAKVHREMTAQDFQEKQVMGYKIEEQRTLEDMMDDIEEDDTIGFIRYERSAGPIDLQQLFESTQSMKGDYNEVDSFVRLLTKWWASHDAYAELNSLTMLMESYEDHFWMIKCINEYKMMEFGFEEIKTTQCQLQIDYLLKDINKRLLGLIQDRIDSSLKNIIPSTVFESSRCLYEDGIANSLGNFIKFIYEGALKVSPTYADKLVRQTFHFLNYLIIEKIIQLKLVNGVKGFQLSYLAISLQTVLNQYSVLRKFMDLISPVIEVSKLLTMPISLDIIKTKDEIFPSLSANLIYKLLETYKKDDVNPYRIPSEVFKYLSKHFEKTPIPSRFDLVN